MWVEDCSGQNVSSQIHMWKSHSQCDGIRSWSFGRWLGHEVMPSCVGLVPFEKQKGLQRLPPVFPWHSEKQRQSAICESAPEPTLLVLWSQTSSFQNYENSCLLFYHPVKALWISKKNIHSLEVELYCIQWKFFRTLAQEVASQATLRERKLFLRGEGGT